MLRNIITSILTLIALHSTAADYDSMWRAVNTYQSKDEPKMMLQQLQKIISLAQTENCHGEYLAARLLYARTEADINPNSIPDIISSLRKEATAAEQKDAVYGAMFNFVLSKICHLSSDADAPDSQYYLGRALSNPDILASAAISDYKRLVIDGDDGEIWHHDLLSLIGNDAARYDLLRQYYDAHGNRRAACVQLYLMNKSTEFEDDLTRQNTLAQLREGITTYSDLPECALLDYAYYRIINRDEDVADETRYTFLTDAIKRYEHLSATKDSTYRNNLISALKDLTQSRMELSIERTEGQDRPVIKLKYIRNVTTALIEFLPLDADGSIDFHNTTASIKQLLKMQKGDAVRITRQYDKPVWMQHEDSFAAPQLPYGVYLVKASCGDRASYDLFYHSALTVLTLPIENKKKRIIVVSATTGQPVPGANIVISPNYRSSSKKNESTLLKADAKGETTYSDEQNGLRIRAYTDSDKGMKTCYANSNIQSYEYTETNNILTIFTDRSIYRPGQTVSGFAVVHHAANEDSIHIVTAQKVDVSVSDAEGKKIHTCTVITDEHGHAAFSFTLPADCKMGHCSIECHAGGSAYASIRVEEYKRPSFEVTVVEKEKYETPIDVAPRGEADELHVQFKAQTYAHVPVSNAEVRYTIRRRQQMWRWWHHEVVMADRCIVSDAKAVTDSDGMVTITFRPTPPEGRKSYFDYLINVSITDDKGETHEQNLTVTAHRTTAGTVNEDPTPAEEPEPWFAFSSSRFSPDGTVTFTANSRDKKNVHAYYTIYAEDKAIESGCFDFTHQYKREFRYKREYGRALTVACAWVMDGEVRSCVRSIIKPQPDLALKTTWTTFRDRTQPGSKETWTLKLENAQSRGVLGATIYDTSLDAIYPNNWSINVLRNSYNVYTSWTHCQSPLPFVSVSGRYKGVVVKANLEMPRLDTDYLPYIHFLSRSIRVGKSMAGAVNGMPMALSESAMADVKMAKATDGASALSEVEEAEEVADLSALLRTDLAETAFFTPSLVDDEHGNINISFTMPETMTTWRLCALVHDDKMRHAILDKTCVAQKNIIVSPNVPRFLRQDDCGILAATVSNTTDSKTSAKVTMQLLDAQTESVVWQHTEQVDIEANGTAALAYQTIAVPHANELLMRIAAVAADGSSDGEQHLIPVMPQTEKVTTTVAFTQRNGESYSRDISELLFDSSIDRTLLVRYTPHAVQMILDAIPTATAPANDDALSLATAVYVATLFNSNDSLRSQLTTKLGALQLDNGSWAWWHGMSPSIYTTSSVCQTLARLHNLGYGNDQVNAMLHKAAPYLAKNLADEVKILRKLQKEQPNLKIHPSETATTAMYIFALSQHLNADVLRKHKSDVNYLISLIEKSGAEMTIYGKAHSAALLAYYGRTKRAMEHLESMKQYSICTDEAGRYYDTHKAYYSWRNYRIPTQVAAMEAIRICTPHDSLTIQQMQQWLLHEKRTQQWDSSINTADAIHAFCLDNSELDSYRRNKDDGTLGHTTLALDGMPILADSVYQIPAETGTGMFTATTNNAGGISTSWGGIIVTQTAPLSSIQTRSNGFTIKREIIGNQKVGERVTVRITIEADRDYDFVQVTDNRPACLEPVVQLSGYHSAITGGSARGSYSGYYRQTRDKQTSFFFDHLAKGTHVIETDYYIDRVGTYHTGTATVQCTYAPEFSALQSPTTITIP